MFRQTDKSYIKKNDYTTWKCDQRTQVIYKCKQKKYFILILVYYNTVVACEKTNNNNNL